MKKNMYLLLFLSLFWLTSCKNNDVTKNKTEYVIGFSQLGSESTWRKQNTKSVLAALEKNHFDVMYENALHEQDNQINAIRSFISYNVDLIVLAPITESGWNDILTEAKNAKIPVVILDREINVTDDSLYITHVGSNFKSQGIRAGQFLMNKFSKQEEPVNIVEVLGTKDATPTIYRHQGFSEIISREEKFKIVNQLEGDYTKAKGKELIKNLIAESDFSTIDVIYSHNDDMTLGIIEELEEQNINPGKDITIISIDGQKTIMDKLAQGKINCVVECNPNSGDILANVIQKILSGKNISREINMTETSFSEFSQLSKMPSRNY